MSDNLGRGAGEGNRTLVVSLGSFCSAIELRPHWRRDCHRLPPAVKPMRARPAAVARKDRAESLTTHAALRYRPAPTRRTARSRRGPSARMAELVDAPSSGGGAGNGVEVRVLFRAPFVLAALAAGASRTHGNLPARLPGPLARASQEGLAPARDKPILGPGMAFRAPLATGALPSLTSSL